MVVRRSLRVYWALIWTRLRRHFGIIEAEAAKRNRLAQLVNGSLEGPSKMNPTLDALEKISKVFAIALLLLVAS